VEETELLGYLLQDPATKVICLYLESFVQGRGFLELAAVSEKPIVLLKGGKSPSGAVAVASHTASLAGNDDRIQGALRQAGVYQADDFFEMIDMARALERAFPVHISAGERARIAVLSYSGASGIVTADHLEKWGLSLASLSTSTLDRLQSLSPQWMPIQNPVDFWPAIEKHGVAATYKKAIKPLHEDPQGDGLIVHLFSGLPAWSIDVAEIVPDLHPPLKPILFWTLGEKRHVEATRRSLEELGWPVFDEIQRMVRVMACLFESRPKAGRPSWVYPDLTPPAPGVARSLDLLALQADREPE
jgi:acetyltransferase